MELYLRYTCSKVLLDARVSPFYDAIVDAACRICASACPQLTRSTNTTGGMKRPPNDRCCSAVSRLHCPHMGWMGLICPVLEQILRCLGQKIYEHIAASAYTSNTCMIGQIIRTCLTWSTLGRNGSRATREPKNKSTHLSACVLRSSPRHLPLSVADTYTHARSRRQLVPLYEISAPGGTAAKHFVCGRDRCLWQVCFGVAMITMPQDLQRVSIIHRLSYVLHYAAATIDCLGSAWQRLHSRKQ